MSCFIFEARLRALYILFQDDASMIVYGSSIKNLGWRSCSAPSSRVVSVSASFSKATRGAKRGPDLVKVFLRSFSLSITCS